MEIIRLSAIKDIDTLVKIAKARNDQDMEIIMAVQLTAADGLIHVLPGDDFYPETPNFHENVDDSYTDRTMAEMRAIAKRLNRYEMDGLLEIKLFVNVEPTDGHIALRSDLIAKM